MKSLPRSASKRSPELRVTVGTHVLVAAFALAALLFYKASGDANSGLLWGRFRWFTVAAIGSGVGALALMASAFHASQSNRRRRFWVPLVANCMVTLTCVLGMETILRVAAQPDPLGVRVGTTVLLPYDWQAFTRNSVTQLRNSRDRGSFFVEHPVLGWTVGTDRESSNGLYKSSAEGLRSLQRGERLDSPHAENRVALFGDSFTFSEEVPCEQSWSHHLQQAFGPNTQVLNFGVPGYGLDQAYLCFTLNVARWKPRISVLAFIQDDLFRTVSVYPFFKGWDQPLSKPRFVASDHGLVLLHSPVMSADAIVASQAVWDLPSLEYDIAFNPFSWRQSPFYVSYLTRFIATTFPRWPRPNIHTDHDAVAQIGTRLIEDFVSLARVQHTQPIVVYLPSRNDFATRNVSLAQRVIDSAAARGVNVHDLTGCLTKELPAARLFVEDGIHYSDSGNAALAKCTRPLVAAYLNQ